jgi:hypothetical protein
MKRDCTTSLSFLIGLVLIIVAYPCNVLSECQITLQWPANTPSPEGYRIYGRENGNAYNFDEPWWEGDYTFTQCTIDQLDENITYYFVIRAFDMDNNESENSNEVVYRHNPDYAALNTNNPPSASPTSSGSAGCFINTALSLP